MHNIYRRMKGDAVMKENKNKAGWIIGGIFAFLSACAAVAFFLYHSEQERKRMERWRHYDDKYLDK